jgi:hypothetical protein
VSGRLLTSFVQRQASRRETAREEREQAHAVAWRKGVRARRLKRQAQANVPPDHRRPVQSDLVPRAIDPDTVFFCRPSESNDAAFAAAIMAHFRSTGEIVLPHARPLP